MKKIVRIAIALLAVLHTSVVNAQTFDWVKGLQNSKDKSIKAIALDPVGNIVVGGSFEDTLDMDPGAGVHNLTASPYATFLAKYDNTGGLLWSKKVGPAKNPEQGLFVMDAQGYSYMTGGSLMNISKIDPAGNIVWTHTLTGATGSEMAEGAAMAYDPSGYITISGYFYDSIDVDPGPGAFYLVSNTTFGPNNFILKMDTAGNFVWAKQFFTQYSVVDIFSVAVDAAGNVYTTGLFFDSVDFDLGLGNHTLVPSSPGAGTSDMFIQKLHSNGEFAWAKKIGNADMELGMQIVCSKNNYLYALGAKNTTSSTYFFAVKMDTTGAILMNKPVTNSGQGNVYLNKMFMDASSNIWLTGGFGGTVDFDPGPNVHSMTSNVTTMFVLKMDSAAHYLQASKTEAEDTSECRGNGIIVADNGAIYTTGSFKKTVDFDPGPGVFNMTTVQLIPNTPWYANDVFIMKWLDGSVGVEAIKPSRAINIYPNPTNDILHIENAKGGVGKIVIFDVAGRILLAKTISGGHGIIDLSPVSAGEYILQVNSHESLKIIKQR